ncbi:MAG: GldG family protein [Planctomycetota bacterium]|jgi:hypothetical protein|nr:GldG family protein [Planctomycetota bacterium]
MRRLYWLNAWMILALSLGILIYMNLIGSVWSGRIDLTRDQIYTLSPLSQKLASGLTDRCEVTYIVSPSLLPRTARYEQLIREVQDQIEEFAAFSDGQMTVRVERVAENSTALTTELGHDLERRGIRPITESRTGKEAKLPPYRFYSAAILKYGGRTRVIDEIRGIEALEYQIAGALKDLSSFDVPRIGLAVFGASKEHAQDPYRPEPGNLDEYLEKHFQGILQNRYRIERVDLLQSDPSQWADLDLMIVICRDQAPRQAVREIDQFVVSGGNLLLFTDVFNEGILDASQRAWARLSSGLEEALDSWGLHLENSLVLDNHAPIQEIPRQRLVRDPQLGYRRIDYSERYSHAFWTDSETNYNPEIPALVGQDRYFFWLPRAMRPDPETLESRGIRYRWLIRSSTESWKLPLESESFDGDQFRGHIPDTEKRHLSWNKNARRYDLAVSLRGRFLSHFRQENEISNQQADSSQDTLKDAETDASLGDPSDPEVQRRLGQSKAIRVGRRKLVQKRLDRTWVLDGDKEGHIVVFGDARIEHALRWAPEGERLLRSIVAWITRQDELGSIQAKSREAFPLEYDPSHRPAYQALFAFLAPVMVLLFALLYGIGRLQKRESIQTPSSQEDTP